MDDENHQFIDILIENEQKMVISEYVVQVAIKLLPEFANSKNGDVVRVGGRAHIT